MHVYMDTYALVLYRSALDKLDPLNAHGISAISKHPSPINAFMVRTAGTIYAVYEYSTASISAQLHSQARLHLCAYIDLAHL
jgi:hypothetical protein